MRYVYQFPVLMSGHGKHSSVVTMRAEEMLREWNMQETPVDGRIVSAILYERIEHFAPHPMPAKYEVFVVEIHCREAMGLKTRERFNAIRLDPVSREQMRDRHGG